MKKIRITVFVCLMFLTTSFFGAVNVQGYHDWDTDYNVSFTPSTASQYPAVAVRDQYVHVVWSESVPLIGNVIFYARNTNFGSPGFWTTTSFYTMFFLSPYINSITPAIATWEDEVYVVWADSTVTGHYEIYYIKNTNNGALGSWDSTSLEQITSSVVPSINPVVAAENGHVHIAWQSGMLTGYQVWYTRRGISPFPPLTWIRLSLSTAWSAELPTITAQLNFLTYDDPKIYVAYQEKHLQTSTWEIYYVLSNNHGSNWDSEVLLSGDPNSNSYNPSIASFRPQAISGPPTDYTVHVVWVDEHDGSSINYRKIGSGPILTIQSSLTATNPSIAACGLSIGVVWQERDPVELDYDIYWLWSWDNGYNWVSPPEKITTGTTGSIMPAVSVDYRSDYSNSNFNHISVVWAEYLSNNFDIFYKRKQTDESVVTPNTFSSNGYGGRTRTSTVLDTTGGNAYIFGGMTWSGGPSYHDEILRYTPSTNLLILMPTKLSDAGPGSEALSDTSAIWDSQFTPASAYIFGGRGVSGEKDTILRYIPALNSIGIMGTRLPTPMYGTSSVFDGTYAYIIGGYGSSTYYNTILKYDTTFDNFVTFTPILPTARAFTSAVYITTSNDIYIFGGKDASGDVNQVVRIDLDASPPGIFTYTFDIILPGSLGGPRYGTSAVWDPNYNSGNYIYIFGGLSTGADYTSDLIIRFDITTQSQKYMSLSLPTYKGYTSAVWAWDGLTYNAYVFGGYYYAPAGDQIVRYHPPTH